MDICVKKIGEDWAVEFNHGVQYFTLDYFVETKEEADWMKSMLVKCFASAFGENWRENSNCNLQNVSNSVCPFCSTKMQRV